MRNYGEDSHSLNPPPGFSTCRLDLSQGNMRLVHGGQGPPLILIHGLGGSSEDFYLMAPLLARKHTLIIPDLPGFGGSDKPESSYSIDWFIDVLREVCRALGLNRAPWLGHSMGGLLCLLLAARHPGLVERTVAVCPAGGHKKMLLRWRLMRSLLVNRRGGLRIRWAQPLRLYLPLVVFNQWSPMTRDFSRRFIARWQGPQGISLERSFVRAALSIFATPAWPEVKSIVSPVLLVTGSHDLVTTGEQTRRLARHLPPNRKSLELRGGHMLPYTHADELSRAALDFLGFPR